MTYGARFGSVGTIVLVLGGASLALASCSLNPQPEPPGATDLAGSAGAATGAGGSGSGGKSGLGSGGSGGSGKVSAGGSDSGAAGGAAGKGTGGHAGSGVNNTGGSTGVGGTTSAGGASTGGHGGGAPGTGGATAGTGGSMTTGAGGGTSAGAGGGSFGQGGSGTSGGAGGTGDTGAGGGATGGAAGGGGGQNPTGGGAGAGGSGLGGSGTGGSGGGDPIGDACAVFSAAYCDRLATCAPFVVATTWGDAAACKKELAAGCAAELGGTDMPPPSDKKSCAAAVAVATCDDILGATGLPPACIPTTPGPRADGDSCGTDGQCASDFCDAQAGGCGVCAKRPALGDSCSTWGICGPGLLCGPGGLCEDPHTAGQACADDCQPTLACIDGFCAAPGTKDAKCAVETDCDGANGLTCAVSNTCQPFPTAKNGDTCSDLGGITAACVDGTYCDLAAGTCKPRVSGGAMCDSTAVDACFSPAVCTPGNATDLCVYSTLSCP